MCWLCSPGSCPHNASTPGYFSNAHVILWNHLTYFHSVLDLFFLSALLYVLYSSCSLNSFFLLQIFQCFSISSHHNHLGFVTVLDFLVMVIASVLFHLHSLSLDVSILLLCHSFCPFIPPSFLLLLWSLLSSPSFPWALHLLYFPFFIFSLLLQPSLPPSSPTHPSPRPPLH